MNKSILKRVALIVATLVLGVTVLCSCADKNSSSNKNELPKLVIGTDYYEPFVYRDDNGGFAGLDVELATEVCRHIGYTPVFVHIEWAEKNTCLLKGEIDCIWCCFTETGREEDYSWSLPYMNSRQVVAVKSDSGIYKLADLNGKRIAVQSTTKADDIFSGRAGVDGLTVPALKELNCLPNVNYLFGAINEGYVDGIAGHELVLREYMKTSSSELRILEESLLEVRIGVAFSSGTHADIIDKLNDAFKLLKHNGYLAELVSAYGLDPDLYLVDYEEKD